MVVLDPLEELFPAESLNSQEPAVQVGQSVVNDSDLLRLFGYLEWNDVLNDGFEKILEVLLYLQRFESVLFAGRHFVHG